MKNSRLFHSKYLNTRAKLICHMLLVRPVITYAAPCWYNVNMSTMEKFRAFERKCIRICCRVNRNKEHDNRKYCTNKKIYNIAKIPRIDNFIIKITRSYFNSIKNIKVIKKDNEYIKKIIRSGVCTTRSVLVLR